MPPFFRRHWVSLTLLLILLTAGWMRLNGRNWDSGTNWHPDERHVVFDGTMANLTWPTGTTFTDLLDAWHSPINPRMNHQSPGTPAAWVYGTLPVYIVKLASFGAGMVADGINNLAGAYIPGTRVFAGDKQITIPGGQIIPQWDGKIPSGNYFLEGQGVFQSGRTMANLFDLFTVFLVFLIGRRLYGPQAGLLAAAFSAFAVVQIQISNFYIVEPFLVTFMTGMLYFSVVLMQRPGFWPALGAGLCLGFALACKVSVVPLGLVIVAALVLRAVYRGRTRRLGPDPDVADPVGLRPGTRAERDQGVGRALLRLSPLLLLAIVATLVAFFLGDPYAFLQWNHPPDFDLSRLSQGLRVYLDGLGNEYLRQLLIEADNQSGVADVPFTRQFIGTIPGVYHLQQLVQWGMGPASGLVALAALFWGLWRAIRGRAAEILLLSASLVYFATIATLEAKWPRYMLPIVPYLCVLAAGLLVGGLAWSRRAGLVERADEWARAASIRGQEYRESLGTVVRRWAFPVITAVSVLGSLAWAVAWQSIYSQPFSAVQSAQWIVDNVPNGSTMGQESWDETQPIGMVNGRVPPDQARNYPNVTFDIYNDRPSPAEFEYIKGLLAQTDYIVLNSNRMYKTIPKLPWRYPVQGKYYELLFQEKLGYKLVHTGQVAPSIFGITFDDQGVDESYTVYDHPKIYVFQKTSDLSDDELATLFGKAVEKPSLSVRHAANLYDKSLLLDQPVGQTMALGDFNWNPIAQNQWVGLLVWLLVLEGFGLLAWPLVAVVCRRLPDRGYPLAKTVGLLVVAWLTWMAASAHLLPFTVWSIGAATVVLGLISLALWRRMAGELGSFVRDRAWLVIGWEVVFLAAFAFFTLIRMWNPDLWQPWQGGEKPMEFAFINGILRSPYMPPIDSFFADGYINYYYYGQFMVALLIKFVGLDSAVGFNLAISTFFAMTFAGAACVIYNCVALVQRARGWRAPASRTAFGFGLIGALMLGTMGNLAGAGLYIASAFPSIAAGVLPIFVKLNVLSANFAQSSGAFNYWAPRTVIGTLPPTQNTINEFPFWTFLFADLHPHLIDMAFTILVAALALNLLLGAWRWPVLRAMEQAALDTTATVAATPGAAVSGSPPRSGWSLALVQLWGSGPLDALLRFGLTALALGSLAAINTWDFPTYAGLVGVALIGAVILAWRAVGNRTISMRAALLVAAVSGAIVVTVAALILYAPFFISFKNVAVSGGSPLRFIDVINPLSPGMRRTYMSEFISFWGIFIFVAFSYLGLRLWHFPWREAVADWGRWVGGVGRLGPQEVVLPPTPAPAPAPRLPVPELNAPALPAEPSYSAALPSTNGHSADDEIAAPEPAHPLPAFGFTAGFEPLDTMPGDAELAPGLHAATAVQQEAPPTNGADEGADDYVLSDAGALGLALDDDEVRRHSTRSRRSLAPPPPPYDATNGYTGESNGYDNGAEATHNEMNSYPGEADGYDNGAEATHNEMNSYPGEADGYDNEAETPHSDTNGYPGEADGYDNGVDHEEAEPAIPPRRAVPLERPDREPTYTMRVPSDAMAADDSDTPEPDAAPADAPASYTNDELTNDAPPLTVSSALVAEPAPLTPHPIAPPEPLADPAALAPVAAFSDAGSDAGEELIPTPAQSEAEIVSLDATAADVPVDVMLSSETAEADQPVEAAPVMLSEAAIDPSMETPPVSVSEAVENDQPLWTTAHPAPVEVTPDDGSIHVEAAFDETLLADESLAVSEDATVSNVVESPAEPLLTMADIGQPPGGTLPPEPRQRGIIPAGIGLLLLGLTGVAVAGLLSKQEWLLALLTLLIGGLVATHLGGVRAPGTLFGGALLVLGLTVAMAVEVVYLADFLAGSDAFRMNTVFKFYMQVWVLLSMGSAVALYSMIGPQGRLVRRAVNPPAPAVPAAPVWERQTGTFAATPALADPADATEPDYTLFMPPADQAVAPSAEPDAETEDPLGWLVPPASAAVSPMPTLDLTADADQFDSAAAPVDAATSDAEDITAANGDAPWVTGGAAVDDIASADAEDATAVNGDAPWVTDGAAVDDIASADTEDATAANGDAPWVMDGAPADAATSDLDAPLVSDAPTDDGVPAEDTEPAGLDQPPDDDESEAAAGVVLVDPNAAWADTFPVDTVVPDDAAGADEAADTADAEGARPTDSRPGLGPGTYDPDDLTPSRQDDAAEPSEPPRVPPTWSDAEGAAIADAAEEQASLPADPGETRLEGLEIVTHDAPVETDVPDAPADDGATQASSVAATAALPTPAAPLARRVVRRPPVGRPSLPPPPVAAPVSQEPVAPVVPEPALQEDMDAASRVSPEELAAMIAVPAEEPWPEASIATEEPAAMVAVPAEEPWSEASIATEEPAASVAPEASWAAAADEPESAAIPAVSDELWAAAADEPESAAVPAVSDELWAATADEPEAAAIPAVPDEPGVGAPADEWPLEEPADTAEALPLWDAATEAPPRIGSESPWEGPAAEPLPLAEIEPSWAAPVAAEPQTTRVLEAISPESVLVQETDGAPSNPLRLGVRTVWYAVLGLLLLASFVFTVVGTRARVEDRFPDRSQWPPIGTLNGMDWMNDSTLQVCFNGNQTCGTILYKFEREALDWLRKNVNGAPVVADDPHDYYRESGGMVATYTGLPILLGPQHEGEQRYDWQVGERSGDAEEFFRTDSVDRARILIAKYNIEYIYVGQVARISRRELPGAITKFDDMAQSNLLEVAFKNTAVTIYHVKQAAGQLGGEPGKPRPSPTPKPTPTEPPLGTDPQLVVLEAAVGQNPTDVAARQELATYYRDHKNFSKAVVQYQEILKLSPRDVSTYQMLGDTLQEMGDAAAALAAWEEAVKQVPDNPDAHNKVGIGYNARGRYDDAIREFQETVRLNPKFIEASFHLGEVYETLQQKDKAVQAYQAVIANGADTDWARQAQTRIDSLK